MDSRNAKRNFETLNFEVSDMLPVLPPSGYTLQKNLYESLDEISKGPKAIEISSATSLIHTFDKLRGQLKLSTGEPLRKGLRYFFENVLEENGHGEFSKSHFFSKIFPSIAELARNFPDLMNKEPRKFPYRDRNRVMHLDVFACESSCSLDILHSGEPAAVIISQELAASTLACAFLCLFPEARRKERDLPPINFDQLFIRGQKEKLLCLLHYFDRVRKKMPTGRISFERKLLPSNLIGYQNRKQPFSEDTFWECQTTPLNRFEAVACGAIEDMDSNCLQVDFANKFLGGGALGSGCVQEEIRFMISPELIVGMLICPRMGEREAIEVVGAERFSSYKGYGASFTFAGDYEDQTPRDDLGRRLTKIVAIDALEDAERRQYEDRFTLREINKAYCGFRPSADKLTEATPAATVSEGAVATGNWGCGVFKGDLQIKSMIQWMAASQARWPLILYFTFGDKRAAQLPQVVKLVSNHLYSVGRLWLELRSYCVCRRRLPEWQHRGFFEWLLFYKREALPGAIITHPEAREEKRQLLSPTEANDALLGGCTPMEGSASPWEEGKAQHLACYTRETGVEGEGRNTREIEQRQISNSPLIKKLELVLFATYKYLRSPVTISNNKWKLVILVIWLFAGLGGWAIVRFILHMRRRRCSLGLIRGSHLK